jgi:biotin carboxyl carrier protein
VKFEVEANGRRRTIEVQRSQNGWDVIVDGRAMSASLAQAGSRWSLLVDKAGADLAGSRGALGTPTSSYEIALQSQGRGRHAVAVDGRTVSVSIVDPRDGAIPRRGGLVNASGPSSVISPMPGRVVKLLVAPGDVVAARQGVAVVEAMKMENELRAPHAGTVTEVRVREGAPVDANTVLVVIEPRT